MLVEFFRPGVMDRLGSATTCSRRNPGSCTGRSRASGRTGQLRSRAGHDLIYLTPAGVLPLIGGAPICRSRPRADRRLPRQRDDGRVGILAAQRSGEGQFVDVAMVDGALSLLAMPAAALLAGGAPPRRASEVLGGRLLCYRAYACADGYVSVGALEPKFWAAFCGGVGRPRT